jgi:hypothetical protein
VLCSCFSRPRLPLFFCQAVPTDPIVLVLSPFANNNNSNKRRAGGGRGGRASSHYRLCTRIIRPSPCGRSPNWDGGRAAPTLRFPSPLYADPSFFFLFFFFLFFDEVARTALMSSGSSCFGVAWCGVVMCGVR